MMIGAVAIATLSERVQVQESYCQGGPLIDNLLYGLCIILKRASN